MQEGEPLESSLLLSRTVGRATATWNIEVLPTGPGVQEVAVKDDLGSSSRQNCAPLSLQNILKSCPLVPIWKEGLGRYDQVKVRL